MHNHKDPSSPRPSAWAEFYHEFEMRFRGSVESILARLETRYSQRLRELCQSLSGRPRLIDLGCGRGEFLDVAAAAGFSTLGCDESPAAIASCAGRAHTVEVSDILSYLRRQASGSASLVSLLHVIEHCPSPYMLEVFAEAARVTAPGGVFLVETPSLMSLWAGQRQFYLDPTHEKPVHPEYMAFMAEYVGFREPSLLYFDEVVHPERPDLSKLSAELGPKTLAALRQWDRWLFGPMDVALWARKPPV